MGIRIDYTPVGSTLMAAYATGVGTAQDRRRRENIALLERDKQRMWETAQRFQQNQWMNERQNRMFDFRLEEGERDWKRREDMAREGWDREDAWRAEDRERREWEFISKGLADGTLAYTPEQKAQIARWQDLLGRMRAGEGMGPLSPEAQEEALAEIEGKIRGVRPVPTTPDERRVPTEETLRDLIPNYEAVKDWPWFLDERGRPALPSGFKPPEQIETAKAEKEAARRDKRREAVRDLANMILSQKNPDMTQKYTIEQAMQMAEKMIADQEYRDAPVRDSGEAMPAPGSAATPVGTGTMLRDDTGKLPAPLASEPSPSVSTDVYRTQPGMTGSPRLAVPVTPSAERQEEAMAVPGIPRLPEGTQGEQMYESMRPGTYYIGPDGQLRRKK